MPASRSPRMPASDYSRVTGVIFATGCGQRMNSRRPKPAHLLLGKPLVQYPIDLCRRLGVGRAVVAIPSGEERVREVVGEDVESVVQDPSSGLGALFAG